MPDLQAKLSGILGNGYSNDATIEEKPGKNIGKEEGDYSFLSLEDDYTFMHIRCSMNMHS